MSAACAADKATLTVFALTLLVHRQAPGGAGITLPWLIEPARANRSTKT